MRLFLKTAQVGRSGHSRSIGLNVNVSSMSPSSEGYIRRSPSMHRGVGHNGASNGVKASGRDFSVESNRSSRYGGIR